jgi:AcrR family transcriptional regulator
MDKSNDIKGFNRPKTRIGISKMNKLVEVAEELFTSKGFYQTSISDICKAAKTAVGTFYIYFESKTDIYHYMMDAYEKEIKHKLAESIKDLDTRYEKEREGIKCFIRYAVEKPNVYNIIWGSLSVDRQLFINYYVSFAKSYTKALLKDADEMQDIDPTTVAYILMGISNFLGLRAMFENMSDEDIDKLVDESLMPALSSGIFTKKPSYI